MLVHDGVEAVVEVAARELEPQQRFEQMRPAHLGAEGDVARLAVERDDGLHVARRVAPLLLRHVQLVLTQEPKAKQSHKQDAEGAHRRFNADGAVKGRLGLRS